LPLLLSNRLVQRVGLAWSCLKHAADRQTPFERSHHVIRPIGAIVVDDEHLPVHPGGNRQLRHSLEPLTQQLASVPRADSNGDVHFGLMSPRTNELKPGTLR